MGMTMQPLPLQVLIEDSVVKLVGKVTVHNASVLERELTSFVKQIQAIDCQQLQTADSSFLAFLLWLQAKKHQLDGGHLVVRHTSEALQTLRQLYDLEKVLIFES